MKILYQTDNAQIQQFGGMIHIVHYGKTVIAMSIQDFKIIADKIELHPEESRPQAGKR